MGKQDPHERAADFEAKQEERVLKAKEEAKRLADEIGVSAGTGGSMETMTALPDEEQEQATRPG